MKGSYFTDRDMRILGSILRFSQTKNTQLYIVGGFLRDIILGRLRSNLDIDFAIKRNAIDFAAGLAKKLSTGFVVLDKANGCARLVKRSQDRVYTLDFTDFRGKDLWQDLSRRDFSINTLAVELKAFLDNAGKPDKTRFGLFNNHLIDPFCGLRDLRRGIIKTVSPSAFDDDPLRILRTFSLSCILNFKIEPKTLGLVKKKRIKLKSVSYERIRDELFKILASPRSYEFLSRLGRYRLLELIIPEIKAMYRLNQGPYHHLDVWQHTLETINQLEKIISHSVRNQDIRDYLSQEISSGRHRRELIKLGGLLHDIAKPKTMRIEEGKIMFHGHERVGSDMLKEIAGRLKLSNEETGVLKQMIRFHLRPGYLADSPVLTPRAKFRFFRDAAEESVSVLLISLADQRATKGYLTTQESRQRHERVVRRLIKEYFQKRKQKKPTRLINGHDLIKRFRLEPSPLIGRILSEIEETQAIGRIQTKTEAMKIAERIIKRRKNERG
jgi:poly(A) polymerase